MNLIKQINEMMVTDSLKERADAGDCMAAAELEARSLGMVSEAKNPCSKFMDPSRIDDFSKAIAELMDDGMDWEEAKQAAFDETEVPPTGSPCCKILRKNVEMIRGKKA